MLAVAADSLAVGVADAQALRAKAASGDKEALRGAARQFESMMVAQMLKTMRETRFNAEDDPMTGGDSLKLYQELLDQQWAAKMSGGKGLGFADMMIKSLERFAGTPAQATPAAPGTSAAPSASASAASASVASGSSAAVGVPAPLSPSGTAPSSSALPQPCAAPRPRKQQFLAAMLPQAEAAAAATGVPARFILGHAALESGWGAREIRGQDGQSSHNLFGIKAGSGWSGKTAETVTTEYRQGVPMKLAQSFRSYDDYGAAFTDYAQLLKARYGAALGAGQDASGFAQGLAAGGYASDPAYADKLQSVIASVAMAGV